MTTPPAAAKIASAAAKIVEGEQTGREALAALRAKVPAVDCIPGCTDCCGVIPMVTHEEVAEFGPFSLARVPGAGVVSMSPHCPNASSKGCRIHSERPFICRMFGTLDPAAVNPNSPEARMLCPHGRKPKVPLTTKQVNKLMRQYLELASVESP